MIRRILLIGGAILAVVILFFFLGRLMSPTKTKTVTETQTIAHETQTVESADVAAGEQKVQQEGKDGQKQITYQVTTKNGVETKRVATKETVITQPQNEIVAVSSSTTTPPSPNVGVSPQAGPADTAVLATGILSFVLYGYRRSRQQLHGALIAVSK